VKGYGSTSHGREGALLGDTLRVAIEALGGVDVMGAFGREKGGIHLLHVDAAVGQAGMAIGAGGAGLLAMLHMAGQASDAFVDAAAGAVVAGASLA